MAANSRIEWTHHTFNPWRGCAKVSEGCANCYAEKTSKRNPKVLGEWGPLANRVIAADNYWRQPLKWDRDAKAAGERRRVFCASLADVFEDRPDLEAPRVRLFRLIEETPSLDWLLLTKRPENVRAHVGIVAEHGVRMAHEWEINGNPPPNVWIGTSVENQETANHRIPELVDIPACVRFLSCEPLLTRVNLRLESVGHRHRAELIHWVIVGGESGPNARPMAVRWARHLRDQCLSTGIPFFFKQWGAYVRSDQAPEDVWRELDAERNLGASSYARAFRVGKRRSGRLLDGVTWDEFPRAFRELPEKST